MLRILCTLTVMLAAAFAGLAKNVTVGNVVYSVNTSNGRAQAVGLKDDVQPSSITIKQTVQSGIELFAVTSIGNNAFGWANEQYTYLNVHLSSMALYKAAPGWKYTTWPGTLWPAPATDRP